MYLARYGHWLDPPGNGPPFDTPPVDPPGNGPPFDTPPVDPPPA